MDPLVLMIVVFLIYMLSSGIRNRNRDRRRMEENQPQDDPSEVPDHTSPKEQAEDPASPLPSEKTDGQTSEYDYDAFRKKLRTAWHLPDTDNQEQGDVEPEQNTDVKMNAETRTDPSAPADPTVLISKESDNTDQSQTEPGGGEAKEVRKWQQYAQKKAVTPVIQEPSVALPIQKAHQKQWSEKDVEQWVRYEAVFGPPRCRSPWYPMPGPKKEARRV